MGPLSEDCILAIRSLRRRPIFSLAAAGILALGLGTSIAMFAVVRGVLLRPLPWPDSDRIVRLVETHPGAAAPMMQDALSNLTLAAWSESPKTIEEIGAWSSGTCVWERPRTREQVPCADVSPSLFRTLGATPLAGRFFTAVDVVEGSNDVLVVGADLAVARFGSPQAAVGARIILDNEPRTVVGVARDGFDFPDRDVQLWAPEVIQPPAAGGMVGYRALARLKRGSTLEQASTEGTAVARAQNRPPVADLLFGRGRPVEIRATSLRDHMTASIRPALLAFGGATFVLLLIACTSVANLLLTRGEARRRELAVRFALGARRGRIVRQLLLESLVLSAGGGVVGLLLAATLTRAFPFLAPREFPRVNEIEVDPSVAAFAVMISLAAGLIAGILPALRAAREGLAVGLHEGAFGTTERPWSGPRSILLVAEAAFAMILLAGGTLLARSFVRLVSVDGGYERRNVSTANIGLPEGDEQAERRGVLTANLLQRLRATPGVVVAGIGSQAPFVRRDAMARATLPWPRPDGSPLDVNVRIVGITTGYAEALGLRLRAGRFFTEAEATAAWRPILVSEAFVRDYVNDSRPVLRRQLKGIFAVDENQVSEIIGVVGDVLQRSLDSAAVPTVYVPLSTAHTWTTVVVRAVGQTASTIESIKRAAAETDSAIVVTDPATLESAIAESVREPRFAAIVFATFSTVALVLAGAGLFGALSLLVSQSRRELGVRSALGALPRDLVTFVLGRGLRPSVAGIVVGVGVALALSRVLRGLLFAVAPTDPVGYGAAALLLVSVSIAAAIIPAHRAARTNPIEVLRSE